MRSSIARAVALLCAALLVAGCATPTVHKQTNEWRRTDRAPRILLMPFDVELSELSAGGVSEPKAEWTEAAQKHMEAALLAEATERRLDFVKYDPSLASTEDREMAQDLVQLHRAVGASILLHQYAPALALPTKAGKFDWSLGPAAERLAKMSGADYAAFFFVRDSYASSGRVAVMVVGAVLGIGVSGGTQIGFASFVDLKSGDIVYFNRLLRQSGDLRTNDPARETVRALLVEAPR